MYMTTVDNRPQIVSRLRGHIVEVPKEALAASGMNNNPVLAEAFHAVGTLLSEDALSGGRAAPAAYGRETAEETYKNMFRR